MVRRLRKQKSYCYVIAIPQASIVAPTLTVMQGFEAKKALLCAYPSQFLRTASILRFFHSTQPKCESNPGAMVRS